MKPQRLGRPSEPVAQRRTIAPPVLSAPANTARYHRAIPTSTPNALDLLAVHWPVLAVVAVFLATMTVVPVFANAPSTDDWVYSRSVEILVDQGRLEVHDLTVVTLIFQVIWGAIFSLIFGTSFGAMRLSTVILVAASIPAVYGICRLLGVGQHRAVLGAAIYAFNPLTFALAFTFMSDPQFTALMIISVFWYVRGFQLGPAGVRSTLIGSVFAALAFLTRQQGLLVPLAIGVYLAGSGQWRPNREGMIAASRIAGIPFASLVLYTLWLMFVNGTPEQQGAFLTQIQEAGVDGSVVLFNLMTYIELAYVGLFVLPITLSLFGALRSWRLADYWTGLPVLAAWFTILVLGAIIFTDDGRRMPYIQQFLGLHGVGPTDILGGRPIAGGQKWTILATVVSILSAAIYGLFLARAVSLCRTQQHPAAVMVGVIALFQVAGILPPSYHFREWIISVDRYLLPLVPLSVCLLLWAIRDVTLNTVRAWTLTGIIALFSVVATRDCLVFQDATWDTAAHAIEIGVPLTQLDAGASWDGYHLYEFSESNGITQRTPGGPWWTDLFGPATDSTYIVSTVPIPGYVPIMQREYSSWLHREPTYLYLSQKASVPSPP
jgi:4-amino-4-deoxy-L-arabinose transferase-like glycosyltransferase